jgi:hypothetical protein
VVRSQMDQPDSLEVARMAHELQYSHGVRADEYATQLAAEARADGQTDDHVFWSAVAAALRLRKTE